MSRPQNRESGAVRPKGDLLAHWKAHRGSREYGELPTSTFVYGSAIAFSVALHKCGMILIVLWHGHLAVA
ncbi:MAG: hypothetical protein F6K63_23050 [Moorea sp. SIO1G6]|uniref:hypothetical protein n=1 Tax=Moorena sp. SIO1G6 TaxID=2607840 RepID=UPI0013C02626|nr:hypothetical protein [Moorena sp. SIO1G6]NET67103.1 hypothetical protein [Moorena sp. SIO1G6]